jgi:hypothetical protein
MLRKLFSARSSRPSPQTNSIHPRLEALEDRLALDATIMQPAYGAPTSINMTQTSPTEDGYFGQQTLLPFGLPPSGYTLYALGGVPVGGYVAVPGQSVGATTGGVGDPASAAGNGGGGGGGGGGGAASSPVGQVEQVIGALYKMAASQNPQQANSLVMDEIFQAVDTFIDNVGKEMGMNFNRQGSASADQNAINHNPLEHSQVGQMLGSLVYDLTYYMLATGQTGGF